MDKGKKYFDVLAELLDSNYDLQKTTNEQYAKQLVSVHSEFVKRNSKLTKLLEDYIRQREKRVLENGFLKKFLFWFFIGLLGVLTIAVVAVFVGIDFNKVSISSTVSLLSVAVTYLGSIIAIFEIISKYLFPADEEKDTISMIKTVIDNDIKVEEVMSKAIHDDRYLEIEQLKSYKALLDEEVITQKEFDNLKKSLLSKLRNN